MAAGRLRVAEAIVGRRLARLQAGMGLRLLQRLGEGYTATLAGKATHAGVERLERAALLSVRGASGHETGLDGLVRVSSPELLTHHLLTPAFAALHARHPGIQIELLPQGSGLLPAAGAAEVVLRLRCFGHRDLVVHKLGTVAFGLYAGADYLARSGAPDLGRGCPGHRLVTLLDDGDLWPQAAWLLGHAGRADVVLRTDGCETQHRAVCGGVGLAVLPCFRADLEPALRRISTSAPIPAAEAWVGVDRRNRHVPRVRMVLGCIAEAESARMSVLNPAEAVGEAVLPTSAAVSSSAAALWR